MFILSSAFLIEVVFLTIVFLHLTKKNFGATLAYALQSLAIVLILLNSFFETKSIFLLLIVILTFVVKAVLAPVFFVRLIQKHSLIFSVSTYLNLPLTLIVAAILTAVTHMEKLAPLTGVVPEHQALLTFALSAIFLSFFLIVNRKGALSQIIGILSLENSIVAFTVFAGLEQSAILQLGIIFDIFIWLIIATVFVGMIYKHFGTLDVTSMKHLTE